MLRFHLERASRRFRVGLRANCAPDAVWAVLSDTRLWPRWGPSITKVEVDGTDSVVHEGMRGRVRTVFGRMFPFVLEDVDPPRSWGWRVAGVKATGHEVIAEGDGGAWIVFSMPWWAFFYAPVCLWAARRISALARTMSPPGGIP
ncbi:MAG: SRPBCC family protein [Desulfosoma sp.]